MEAGPGCRPPRGGGGLQAGGLQPGFAGPVMSTAIPAAATGNPSSGFGSAPWAAFLAPAEYIDSDHPAIVAQTERLCADTSSSQDAARAIFRFVRDLPYIGGDLSDIEIYRASRVLATGHGHCVCKASLCTALARAAGIPARIAFADVRNHLASPRVLAAMGTDIFAWHGFVELRLGDEWVKASPTFDTETCRRHGVAPLEFDAVHDALLQSFDNRSSMEYQRFHGSFHDVPARFLAAEIPRLYPKASDGRPAPSAPR
jgi:transglutaminase-like putative cysteine protease